MGEPGMRLLGDDREAMSLEQRDIAGQHNARCERQSADPSPPGFSLCTLDQRSRNPAPSEVMAHGKPRKMKAIHLRRAEQRADQCTFRFRDKDDIALQANEKIRRRLFQDA